MNGTFTATGSSDAYSFPPGQYNLSLSGLPPGDTARVTLERSFDGGATWRAVGSFTANAEQILTVAGVEDVPHRLTCDAFAGGGIHYRIG